MLSFHAKWWHCDFVWDVLLDGSFLFCFGSAEMCYFRTKNYLRSVRAYVESVAFIRWCCVQPEKQRYVAIRMHFKIQWSIFRSDHRLYCCCCRFWKAFFPAFCANNLAMHVVELLVKLCKDVDWRYYTLNLNIHTDFCFPPKKNMH